MANGLTDKISEALSSEAAMRSEPPWRLVTETSAGGAYAAGFDRVTDELLVVTSNGQGIFDAATGQRIYRNRDDSGYDPEHLVAIRRDRAGDHQISMAGDDGGGLRRTTSDGWTIDILQVNWPTAYSILQPPGASIYFLDPQWEHRGKDASFRVLMKSGGLPVTFGFSWSGKSLVWLDRSDLFIWHRG